MSNYDKAIADFEKVISLDPQEMYAYRGRAGAYSLTNRMSQAIADYTTAIKMKPNNADSYYLRGSAYDLMGKKAEAIADMRKSLSLNPKDQATRNFLANLLSSR
jgi:tetratricopeptide (TPR) repeat protein